MLSNHIPRRRRKKNPTTLRPPARDRRYRNRKTSRSPPFPPPKNKDNNNKMLRTAIIRTAAQATRAAAVRPAVAAFRPAIVAPVSRAAAPRWAALQTVRMYSAGSGLEKKEVEDRIVGILQNFDKVSSVHSLSRLSRPLSVVLRCAVSDFWSTCAALRCAAMRYDAMRCTTARRGRALGIYANQKKKEGCSCGCSMMICCLACPRYLRPFHFGRSSRSTVRARGSLQA